MKEIKVQEAAIKYFKIDSYKRLAEKTKPGDVGYINPDGYNKALEHYKKMMLPEFDGTLKSAKMVWPEFTSRIRY